MRYSQIATIAALSAAASAVVVTEFDYAYQTVTVNGQGSLVGTDNAQVSTVEEDKKVNNLVYVTTVVYGNGASASSVSVATSTSAAAASSVETSPAGQVVTQYVTQGSSSETSEAAQTTTLAAAQTSSTAASSTAEDTAAAVTTSASAAASSSSSSGLSDMAESLLNVHNTDRSAHSAPSMTWNDTLAEYAQTYLDNQNCVFAHSGGPYGENIALGFSSVADAADAWYDEYKLYNYAAGEFSESTGHFTQMVWKASVQLGCATVQCSSGQFLACEYYPRGNIIGEFTENVFEN